MSDDDQPTATMAVLDEASGRALVEAWRASGLSGAAFCRQRQIRAQRLHYWRERLGYAMRTVARTQPHPGPDPPSSDGFVQVVVATPSVRSEAATMEVLVGGAVLRVQAGFDAVLLRAVVGALSQA